ncbi:MAG: CRTAC1 family protein [Planctomycetia bacterium]|nr:CRTAC1 family protein [Planctomycetia bacterium]
MPQRASHRHQIVVSVTLIAVTGLVTGFIGCSSSKSTTEPTPEPVTDGPNWFEDVTDAWGIDFLHDAGPTGNYYTPQPMGSGAAAFDFNGDDLLDVYLLQFGGPNSKSVNRLYRQTAPGKFQDVTAGSGLDVSGHNHGVAVGDVNNDGKPDVLLTQFSGIKLFLNLGGGKFADITAESGLVNLSWGTSAAFLDYNLDGWLDLVVVNYLDYDPNRECRFTTGELDYCGPSKFPGTKSKLYRNRGPQSAPGKPPSVAFEDVSFASGIGRLVGPGLGVTPADFNGDGWPDIFIANDGEPNRLWINQKKDDAFADEAVSRGVAYSAMGKAYAGMGVAVGDVNNDGLVDLYVTHLGDQFHTLWRQGPRGQFRDKTVDAGLTGTKWRGTGFGTLMADFNNDGALDIAQVNGRVLRGGPGSDTGLGFWEPYAEKNQLFANDGTGKFRDISPANKAFCDLWNVARGLIAADFDRDGGVDLLVTAIGTRARLYKNVAPNRGHWIAIRALDPKLNREAYGAEVRVRAGGKEFVRLVNPADSYLCSGPQILHFGLGTADSIEWVQVTWIGLDGPRKETFPGGATNRVLTLKRGEGKSS